MMRLCEMKSIQCTSSVQALALTRACVEGVMHLATP